MIDLELRLADLGETLAIDEPELVDRVLARLVDQPTGDLGVGAAGPARSTPAVRRAAAVALVAAMAALLAIPGSRHAIADWFGLVGVDIERRPELSVPAEVPPADREPVSSGGTVVTLADIPVLVDAIDVGEFDGRLDEAVISKTLGAETGIEQVVVAGHPGLWIDREPHVVSYRSIDGSSVSARFAANTLLWQDGDVIRRVEGFSTLAEALAFAATLD